ncbi:hypothetical protein BDB01DRAFT_781677 [Pilobolus umbonatus]|nr:hypothetical protein BDB01DRAFT_781677 [Pilobolus umbonatus]
MLGQHYYCRNCKVLRSCIDDIFIICHICGNTCTRETLGTHDPVDLISTSFSQLNINSDDEESLEERCLLNSITCLRYQSDLPVLNPPFQEITEISGGGDTITEPIEDRAVESPSLLEGLPSEIDDRSNIVAFDIVVQSEDSNQIPSVTDNTTLRLSMSYLESLLDINDEEVYDYDAFEVQFLGDLISMLDGIYNDFSQPNTTVTTPSLEMHGSIAHLDKIRLPLDDPVLQDECIICQDLLSSELFTVKLPCKHIYHSNCITQWLMINCSCPICRHVISRDIPFRRNIEEDIDSFEWAEYAAYDDDSITDLDTYTEAEILEMGGFGMHPGQLAYMRRHLDSIDNSYAEVDTDASEENPDTTEENTDTSEENTDTTDTTEENTDTTDTTEEESEIDVGSTGDNASVVYESSGLDRSSGIERQLGIHSNSDSDTVETRILSIPHYLGIPSLLELQYRNIDEWESYYLSDDSDQSMNDVYGSTYFNQLADSDSNSNEEDIDINGCVCIHDTPLDETEDNECDCYISDHRQ